MIYTKQSPKDLYGNLVIYDDEVLKTMMENPVVLSDRERRQECVTPNGFAPDRYVLDVGDIIGMSEGASDVDTMGMVLSCAPAGTGVSTHPVEGDDYIGSQ
jgi:hypothetical protein